MTDDLENPFRWQIGASCDVPPGGFVIIWLDGEPEQGDMHAPFKIKSEGEQIGICRFVESDTAWIDSLTFGNIPKYSTLGRKSDGDSTFYLLGDITPGASNNEAGLYIAPPIIQPAGRMFDQVQKVSIFSPDTSIRIYYTLDGSEPDTTSLLYNDTLIFNESKQITAKAFKTGCTGISSKETYIKKIEANLPVLSLEMDRDDLFDDEKGIYIIGTNGILGYCLWYEANWNQDWERPCSITMFEPDESLAFKVNAGIKIGGGCSRGYNMKGFNVFLRGRYGDDFIAYEIFTGSGINEYHRIKIRNAGSDYGSMMLRDGLNHLLLYEKADIDLMNYRPAILYINGEFWGLYGIREFFNTDYIMSHHGYGEDEIDMIKSPCSIWSEIKAGDDKAFNNMYEFIEDNDLSISENYQQLSEEIDIDEYINYNIAEIYYANYDWPAINNTVWKPKNDGKWRWMLFDVDGSANFDLWYETYPAYNSILHATVPDCDCDWPNTPESTILLRKLFENAGFRNEFVQRTCTFIELIFNSGRVNHFTDSLVNLIDPVMDMQVAKWGINNPDLGWGITMEGSREEWEENVQDYKDFFSERPYYMRQHIIDYFNLDGTYILEINNDNQSGGNIFIHNNEMLVPQNYSGIYIKNIPIRLKAVPNEGYYFYKWKETGETNAEISFTGNEDASLTPIFTTSLSVKNIKQFEYAIYPNPSNGIINIRAYNNFNYPVKVEIFNSLGQEVMEISYDVQPDNNKKIDLSSLNNGLYLIRISSDEGEYYEKIILAR